MLAGVKSSDIFVTCDTNVLALFTEYQKCVAARQQLDAQFNENTLVKQVMSNVK